MSVGGCGGGDEEDMLIGFQEGWLEEKRGSMLGPGEQLDYVYIYSLFVSLCVF